MNQIKHGPFTWNKQELTSRYTEEVWVLERPNTMTSFVLKNYGGTPGEGFAGWKLVSGGPFDDAGAYSNLDDAIKGVTPYLIEYYRRQAVELIKNANQMITMVSNFIDPMNVVSAGEHLRGGV